MPRNSKIFPVSIISFYEEKKKKESENAWEKHYMILMAWKTKQNEPETEPMIFPLAADQITNQKKRKWSWKEMIRSET